MIDEPGTPLHLRALHLGNGVDLSAQPKELGQGLAHFGRERLDLRQGVVLASDHGTRLAGLGVTDVGGELDVRAVWIAGGFGSEGRGDFGVPVVFGVGDLEDDFVDQGSLGS